MKPNLRTLPHSLEDLQAVVELRSMQTVIVANLLLYENNATQLSSYLRSEGMLSSEERTRIRRKVGEEDQGSQQDAHKDQGASIPFGEASFTSPQKKKVNRKNTHRNEIVLAVTSARVSPHISPRPIPQVLIPTGTSTLPSNNWRARLALDDRGGETQSAWDVHFSGEGVLLSRPVISI
ncbi:hypothetical protein TSUD_187660 [Trifolium subterraneum]|uniref:Uncharacterized protein n=1 Tax=Trifolium subterraneum TaxID=3900 RepID=A0A2Z6PTB8_TRISU|nr:hypothetical protein TSUD_187660 [Trifolium subterraneum]